MAPSHGAPTDNFVYRAGSGRPSPREPWGHPLRCPSGPTRRPRSGSSSARCRPTPAVPTPRPSASSAPGLDDRPLEDASLAAYVGHLDQPRPGARGGRDAGESHPARPQRVPVNGRGHARRPNASPRKPSEGRLSRRATRGTRSRDAGPPPFVRSRNPPPAVTATWWTCHRSASLTSSPARS